MNIDIATLAIVTGGQVLVQAPTNEQRAKKDRCVADAKKTPWWNPFGKSEEGCWADYVDAVESNKPVVIGK